MILLITYLSEDSGDAASMASILKLPFEETTVANHAFLPYLYRAILFDEHPEVFDDLEAGDIEYFQPNAAIDFNKLEYDKRYYETEAALLFQGGSVELKYILYGTHSYSISLRILSAKSFHDADLKPDEEFEVEDSYLDAGLSKARVCFVSSSTE